MRPSGPESGLTVSLKCGEQADWTFTFSGILGYSDAMDDSPLENLTPLPSSAQNRCFGCGLQNPVGLQLKFLATETGAAVAFVTLSDCYEGPVGYLHGGILATLLDEVMSKSIRATGVAGVTRSLEIEYLRPVPSNSSIRLEAHLDRREGRKFFTRGKILSADGTTLATGKALFIEVRGH